MSRIRDANGQTVEVVFQVGRARLQAKQELPHGEFQRMVEQELPFNSDTARRYIAIVSAEHFKNHPIGTVLPSFWRTLGSFSGSMYPRSRQQWRQGNFILR